MAAQETRIPAWRRLGLALKNESQSGVAVPEPSTPHSDLQHISSVVGPDGSRANLQQPSDVAVNGKSSKLGKRKHHHEPADHHDQASKRGKKSSPSPANTGIPASDIATVPQPDNDHTWAETNEATPTDTTKPTGDPNYRKKKTKSKKSKSRNQDEGEHRPASNGTADHGRPSLSPAAPAPNAPVLLASTETDHGFPAPATTPQKSSHFQKGLSDSPSGTERRKSVAFTPDTKKADGSSAQNLFKKWVAEQKGSLSESTGATEPKPQQTPTDSSQKPKKHDRPEKDNKQATNSNAKEKTPSEITEQTPTATESETAPVPTSKESEEAKSTAAVGKKGKKKDPSIYLSYLTQYHTDRANWKFNKAKQNDVLDNSLNIFRIPEQYTEALLEYVQGLQGAGVIERLKEKCEATLKELETEEAKEQNAMDNPADRKAAHDEALQKRVKQEQKRRATDGDVEAVANHPHPENYIRRLRRTRGEALLAALARAAPILPITQTGRTHPLAHSLAPPTRDSQKRKRRVDVSSDDSSSDSSSEEDSDSSESDESSESSESSSDDSSDSSSDEDSDSDSDDE